MYWWIGASKHATRDPLTQAQSAEDSRSTAMEYYDKLDINMQSKMRFIWRL